jgi:anti-sigma regulatory factor (Ser/Thr protein kinase)
MPAENAQMAPSRRARFEFGFSLQPDAHAPSEARGRLAALLPGGLSADLVDTLLLLTTELVTNGVRHSTAGVAGGGTVDVAVGLEADRIRVEVSDPGSGFHHVPHMPGTLSEGGRGLFLVEALAGRWGMGDADRTTVWFELAVESDERPARADEAALAGGADEIAAELRALGAANDSLQRKARDIEADLARVAGNLRASAEALRTREKVHRDPGA